MTLAMVIACALRITPNYPVKGGVDLRLIVDTAECDVVILKISSCISTQKFEFTDIRKKQVSPGTYYF